MPFVGRGATRCSAFLASRALLECPKSNMTSRSYECIGMSPMMVKSVLIHISIWQLRWLKSRGSHQMLVDSAPKEDTHFFLSERSNQLSTISFSKSFPPPHFNFESHTLREFSAQSTYRQGMFRAAGVGRRRCRKLTPIELELRASFQAISEFMAYPISKLTRILRLTCQNRPFMHVLRTALRSFDKYQPFQIT